MRCVVAIALLCTGAMLASWNHPSLHTAAATPSSAQHPRTAEALRQKPRVVASAGHEPQGYGATASQVEAAGGKSQQQQQQQQQQQVQQEQQQRQEQEKQQEEQQHQQQEQEKQQEQQQRQQQQQQQQEYLAAVEAVAAPDRSVLLALVDQPYAAVAINFYITSLKAYNISNYLILTMTPETCPLLHAHEPAIQCFQYRNYSATPEASQYGSRAFIEKMNVRTIMILEALQANFTVLHSDCDIIFFANPLQRISCVRGACDMAILMDTSAYNAGFLLVHPSPASLSVYRRMWGWVQQGSKNDDQKQLNWAIRKEPRKHIVQLSTQEYVCGKYYYTERRQFADTMEPCSACVVVHNNWIVGMYAKIYRFKELHHWLYDGGEEAYYSSVTRRYVTYRAPPAQRNASVQVDALKDALVLASCLKRTLILPKFRCGTNMTKRECALHKLIDINRFSTHFEFREHSFLTHPLVPKQVKQSSLLINSTQAPSLGTSLGTSLGPSTSTSRGPSPGTSPGPALSLTEQQIRTHFAELTASVLVFDPLPRINLDSPSDRMRWQKKWARGLSFEW